MGGRRAPLEVGDALKTRAVRDAALGRLRSEHRHRGNKVRTRCGAALEQAGATYHIFVPRVAQTFIARGTLLFGRAERGARCCSFRTWWRRLDAWHRRSLRLVLSSIQRSLSALALCLLDCRARRFAACRFCLAAGGAGRRQQRCRVP